MELVDAAAPMRGRAMLTHGEVIAALVVNRLCAPAPLSDIAGWASSAAVAELFSVPVGLLNDDLPKARSCPGRLVRSPVALLGSVEY